MKQFTLLALTLAMFAGFALTVAAQDDDTMMAPGPHVFEITIREVVDADGFAPALAARNELLSGVDGYIGTREYQAFFSFAPELVEGQIFSVGLTEWTSAAAYEASLELDDDPAIAAYNETIADIQTVVVEPFVVGEVITLDDFPDAGEVLEVAIRDIASYDDPVDFLRNIRGFTTALVAEEGVVREYEWISLDGQFFVGMTRYESADAFAAASQSEILFANPATVNIFTSYPTSVGMVTLLVE